MTAIEPLSLIMYEHVDPKRISQAIKSPDVTHDLKKQLQSYSKKWDRVKNAYRVDYEFVGLHYGRRNAVKSLSLQNFKKELRETLVYDTHTDIDIQNCHPVLLNQYCEKNKIGHENLDDYVKNRNIRIQEVISAYGCSRSTAKTFIIRLLYLDTLSHAQLECGFELSEDEPSWLPDLAEELQRIAKMLCANEDAVYGDVKKLRHAQYKNKEATTVSYVIQKIENDIISNACIKLKQLEYVVDTLCFDGVLVNGREVPDDVLEELSSYCFQTTDYQVEFAIKPMKSHYALLEEKYDFSEREFLNLEEWDQVYCMSLDGDTSEETYALRKAYFEKHFAMVEKPTAQYIRQGNGNDRRPYEMSAAEMSQLLKPVKSGFTEAGKIRFFDVWDQDAGRRQYRKMDFMPYNPERPIDDSKVFNLFEGFNPDCYGEQVDGVLLMKRIRPFLDLAHEICGGVDECSAYFHHWIADIFQNPSTKAPVAICVKSKEGVGKNVLLDTIGRMLSHTHYITSSNPEDFFGCHAEGFKGKLLINLNEAEGKKTFDFEGRIKSFITEPTITINPKNIRPMEINNFARTIVTTNKSTPIAIDVKGKDRRWAVFQSTQKTLSYSRKFWGALISHFKKPEFMSALYQYYTQLINNEDFDWAKERPITEEYRNMCDKFQPVEVLFLEAYIREEVWKSRGHSSGESGETITVPTMDLFDSYEQYKKRHRFNKEGISTSSRAFQDRLRELELPLVKKKGMCCNSFVFCPSLVYEVMEERAMINSWKYDEAERIMAREISTINAPEDYFV